MRSFARGAFFPLRNSPLNGHSLTIIYAPKSPTTLQLSSGQLVRPLHPPSSSLGHGDGPCTPLLRLIGRPYRSPIGTHASRETEKGNVPRPTYTIYIYIYMRAIYISPLPLIATPPPSADLSIMVLEKGTRASIKQIFKMKGFEFFSPP